MSGHAGQNPAEGPTPVLILRGRRGELVRLRARLLRRLSGIPLGLSVTPPDGEEILAWRECALRWEWPSRGEWGEPAEARLWSVLGVRQGELRAVYSSEEQALKAEVFWRAELALDAEMLEIEHVGANTQSRVSQRDQPSSSPPLPREQTRDELASPSLSEPDAPSDASPEWVLLLRGRRADLFALRARLREAMHTSSRAADSEQGDDDELLVWRDLLLAWRWPPPGPARSEEIAGIRRISATDGELIRSERVLKQKAALLWAHALGADAEALDIARVDVSLMEPLQEVRTLAVDGVAVSPLPAHIRDDAEAGAPPATDTQEDERVSSSDEAPPGPLRRVLELRGVALDEHWHITLPGLSTRAQNALQLARLATTGELVDLYDRGEISRLQRIGAKTRKELRARLEQLDVADREARASLQRPQPQPPATKGWLERFVDAGFAPDTQLLSLSLDLSVRAEGALKRAKIETLGSLLGALDAGQLDGMRNVGRGTMRELRKTLWRTLERGPEVALNPALSFPDDVDGVFELVFAGLEPRTREILEGRFEHGATLQALGERFNVSRERVRQIIVKVLDDAMRQHSAPCRALLSPMYEAFRAHQGVLHESQLRGLITFEARWRLALLSEVAVKPVWQVAGPFWSTLSRGEREAWTTRMADELQAQAGLWVPHSELVSVLNAQGLGLDEAQAAEFAREWMQLEEQAPGVWRTDAAKLGDQYAALLLEASVPLGADEVSARWQERTGAAREASATSTRAVYSVMTSHPEIVRVGRDQYTHKQLLPVAWEVVESAAARAAALLNLGGEVVLIEGLRQALVAEDRLPPDVPAALLREAMKRRDDVVIFTDTSRCGPVTGHSDWRTQQQLISDLLLRQEQPMGVSEIVDALRAPDRAEASLHTAVSSCRDALALGGARYMHVARVGLTEEFLDALVELALSSLPEDRPAHVKRLLAGHEVGEHPAGAFLCRRALGDQILWGLLRKSDACTCGPGGLVMRVSLGGDVLDWALERFMERHHVFTRRQFKTFLGDEYGYSGASSTPEATIRRREQRGELLSRPGHLLEQVVLGPMYAAWWASRQEHMRAHVESLDPAALSSSDRAWRELVLGY